MNKNKAKMIKENDQEVSEWQKQEKQLIGAARSIIRLLGEQNIEIGDVDRVFAFVKYMIGTIPLNVALPGFEREDKR